MKYFLQILLCFIAYMSTAQSDTLGIQFANAESELTPSHKMMIKESIDVLLDSFHGDIRISGWTDSNGTIEMNTLLSEQRAFNVYDYITRNFDEKKWHSIAYSGNGEMQGNLSAEEKRQVLITFSKRKDKPIEKASVLDDLEIGETMILKNLVFEPGQHTLKKESIPHLFELFEILNINKSIKIQIEGHVWAFFVGDSIKEIEHAKLLSERRAKNIYDFLIRKGILTERLSYVGFGIEKPLPLTTRDPGLNRRVEIRIIEK